MTNNKKTFLNEYPSCGSDTRPFLSFDPPKSGEVGGINPSVGVKTKARREEVVVSTETLSAVEPELELSTHEDTPLLPQPHAASSARVHSTNTNRAST